MRLEKAFLVEFVAPFSTADLVFERLDGLVYRFSLRTRFNEACLGCFLRRLPGIFATASRALNELLLSGVCAKRVPSERLFFLM